MEVLQREIKGIPVKCFPIANVSSDQTVLVNSTFPLDIRGSSDLDGDKLTCSWRFISKPRSTTARLSHSKIQNCINPFSLKFIQIVQNRRLCFGA
jgi:hypothetical protein